MKSKRYYFSCFLKGMDPKVIEIYQLAAKNGDLLQYIPCYYGCGENADHKSNFNCFIKETKADESIVWDFHGMSCGTCLNIVAESIELKNQEKTPLEIRKYIDQKYQSGYAKPTPTPMPAS